MRSKTILQELVENLESAIAAFDRAFLRMLNIKPLDDEKTAPVNQPGDKE